MSGELKAKPLEGGLDAYINSPHRGWFYFKDEFKKRVYRWDRNEGRIRMVDFSLPAIVDKTGVSLARIIRMIQRY